MATEQPRKLPKPTVFDQLYPGRFIKAGELLGKKVTLTIEDVNMEELLDETNQKKAKALISFKETPKQLVCCKTNGICLKEMFGKQLSGWTGKRITIFEDTWNNEPATRIWGSPDIEKDIEVEIALPRRRPFKKTMHKMGNAKGNGAAPPANGQATIDDAKLAAELRATKSLEEHEAMRKSVWALYAAANKRIPQEVDAAATEHAETLRQEAESEGMPL
jgi:hypothetical protein